MTPCRLATAASRTAWLSHNAKLITSVFLAIRRPPPIVMLPEFRGWGGRTQLSARESVGGATAGYARRGRLPLPRSSATSGLVQVRDPFLEYLGLDVAVVRGRPVLVRHEPVDSRAGKRPVAVRRRRVRGKTHYEVIHPQRARRGGAGRLHRTVPRPEFVASLGAFPSVAKRIAALAARAAALRKRAGRAEATAEALVKRLPRRSGQGGGFRRAVRPSPAVVRLLDRIQRLNMRADRYDKTASWAEVWVEILRELPPGLAYRGARRVRQRRRTSRSRPKS